MDIDYHNFILALVAITSPVAILAIITKKNEIFICFFSGILICYISYVCNNILYDKLQDDYVEYTISWSPIIEESLKFIFLCFIYLMYKNKPKSSLLLGFYLGMGFSLVENVYYFFNDTNDYIPYLEVLFRFVGPGIMHCLSASLMSIGIEIVHKHKINFAILSVLFLSILFHATYNIILNSDSLNKFILVYPVLVFIILCLYDRRHKIFPRES